MVERVRWSSYFDDNDDDDDDDCRMEAIAVLEVAYVGCAFILWCCVLLCLMARVLLFNAFFCSFFSLPSFAYGMF